MPSADSLAVHVLPADNDDSAAAEELMMLLREELLELDIASARPVETDAPEDSKGLGAVSSWLVVKLGPASIRSVISSVAAWAARNRKTVELTLDGDTLKLEGASHDQMERALDEWFAHHPAGA